MSDIKIASAKFVDGSFLCQKLFLVFILCFSMDSYSMPALEIDREESTKSEACVKIIDMDKDLGRIMIAGKKIYITRLYRVIRGRAITWHYIFAEQENGTISCTVPKRGQNDCWEFSKHFHNQKVELEEICYANYIQYFPDSKKHHFRIEMHSPFNKNLYEGFLQVREQEGGSKPYYNVHAITGIWKADD